MKGATAEDSAKVMRRARRRRMIIGGPSHHFLRTFKNSQSSMAMEARCLVVLTIFITFLL